MQTDHTLAVREIAHRLSEQGHRTRARENIKNEEKKTESRHLTEGKASQQDHSRRGEGLSKLQLTGALSPGLGQKQHQDKTQQGHLLL